MSCNHTPDVVCDACMQGPYQFSDFEPKGYTDDVVAVMRDTITAQREKLAELEACREQFAIGEAETRRALLYERAKVAALETELEPLRLGRTFWNAVDEGHPAVELLKRFHAWYESEGNDGDLVRLGRDVKTYLAKIEEAA